MKKYLLLIFLLALGLRLFNLGTASFKEDEFITQKAVGYINFCRQNQINCQHRPTTLKNQLISLITNNETKPNLLAEIYLWDFIQDRPSEIHHSRAWPYLYLAAAIQQWLGISEFSLRLAGVLAGALLIPVGFIFARYFSGLTGIGLLYALALALAFPLIDFSRNARMYAPAITLSLLMVYLWYQLLTDKNLRFWLLTLTLLVSLVCYWLHSLTLVLLIGVYIFSWFKSRRWFWFFSGLLIVYALIGRLVGVDFFRKQYLGFSWPPHWQYFNWFYLIGLGLMVVQRQSYWLTLSAVYLVIVSFFTSWRYGSAYAIALWPITLLPYLTWRRWLGILTILLISINLVLKFNYLYYGRDGRADVKTAYEIIKTKFQPNDKIYAVKLRDYYLNDLPVNTEVIDLEQNQQVNFNGSGFVVWEAEKSGYIKLEALEYIQDNFQNLSQGGVNIYRFNL